MAQEGQVAVGPNGERAVFTNGQWVVVPSGARPIAPVDPRIAQDVAQTQANTQRTQTQTRVDEQTAPTTVQTNQAPAGYMWVDPSDPAQGVTPIPGYTAPSQQEARLEPAKLAQLRALEEQIARVEELYNAGPAQTRGVAGVQDYFPTDANAQFDAAGASLAEVGLAAFRVPGVGSQSDNELKQFVEANRPSSGDRDVKIQEKINNLKTRLRTTYEAFGVQPQNPSLLGMDEAPQQPPRAAGVDATEARGEDYSDEYKGSLKDLERQLERGAITAEKYAEGRMAIDRREFGEEAADQTGLYMEEAYQRQRLFGQGITADQLPPPIPPNRQLSDLDQFRNNVAASPLGTGIANFGDAGSLGALSLFMGDEIQAANDLNPNAAMLGQIAGSIGGTAGLGALGRNTIGRALPQLGQGGAKAQLARNVGTDAAYGTIYGANTGMDVEDAALSSVVGSAGGNALGKAVGKTFSGVNVDPAVDYLRSRNIPLTTGQTLGGVAKGIEDRMAGLPFIGDMVNARRLEGLQAFNREAFDEAGRPIGFTSQRIGAEGLNDLSAAQGQAYDAATDGFRAPLDMQYGQDIADIQQVANRLPPDALPAFDQVGENYVMPIINAREMTGDVFQNTQRAMKIKKGRPPQGAQGFEQEWKDAVSAVSDANRGFVNRAGGTDVVRGLDNADQSYRLGKIVEAASGRGKGGSQSGEVRTFTPFQLQGAVEQSQKKFPGVNPLAELADQGQRVLPSRVPDSGTAGRLATLAIPSAAAGGGAGLGFAAGGGEGAQTGASTSAALATALMLLGTKRGQQSLNAILATRPDLARRVGREVSRRSGIFGSAGVPIALESSR